MDAYGLEDHPDLTDEKWLREATRRAEEEARRHRSGQRRRPRPARVRLPRGRGAAITASAVLAVLLTGASVWSWIGDDPTRPGAFFTVDVDEPFAGTPAEGWADGEAGVVAPAAAAVGEFSAEQVAEAYERVRQAVIASRLDRRVVEAHDVEPFLGLLAPELQDHVRPLFDGRNDVEAGLVVTRVARGWSLLPAAPKVSGSMRAEAGEPGELVVRTNYVIAYAFATAEPAAVTGPMDVVAVNRVEVTYVLRSGPGFRDEGRGLWTDEASGFTYSMSCEAADRGFLAPGIADRRIRATGATEAPERYFDPNRPLPTGDDCHG